MSGIKDTRQCYDCHQIVLLKDFDELTGRCDSCEAIRMSKQNEAADLWEELHGQAIDQAVDDAWERNR